jgi:hypothetical protein
MENGDRRRRSKVDILMRAIMDSGRGLVIFGMGIFFLISQKLGVDLAIDNLYRYMFSGLCLLYGGWRIYRGYRKNYYS